MTAPMTRTQTRAQNCITTHILTMKDFPIWDDLAVRACSAGVPGISRTTAGVKILAHPALVGILATTSTQSLHLDPEADPILIQSAMVMVVGADTVTTLTTSLVLPCTAVAGGEIRFPRTLTKGTCLRAISSHVRSVAAEVTPSLRTLSCHGTPAAEPARFQLATAAESGLACTGILREARAPLVKDGTDTSASPLGTMDLRMLAMVVEEMDSLGNSSLMRPTGRVLGLA